MFLYPDKPFDSSTIHHITPTISKKSLPRNYPFNDAFIRPIHLIACSPPKCVDTYGTRAKLALSDGLRTRCQERNLPVAYKTVRTGLSIMAGSSQITQRPPKDIAAEAIVELLLLSATKGCETLRYNQREFHQSLR